MQKKMYEKIRKKYKKKKSIKKVTKKGKSTMIRSYKMYDVYADLNCMSNNNSIYKPLNTTNQIKYLAELAAGGELVGGLQPGHQVV